MNLNDVLVTRQIDNISSGLVNGTIYIMYMYMLDTRFIFELQENNKNTEWPNFINWPNSI